MMFAVISVLVPQVARPNATQAALMRDSLASRTQTESKLNIINSDFKLGTQFV